MKTKPTQPTRELYPDLQDAYDQLNRDLFHANLPQCLITLQRHKGAYGYFHKARMANHDDPSKTTDEIVLNPQGFKHRTTREILATLAHEMAHVWQAHFGRPGRRGYHNQEWADKMTTIGLQPSDTGKPGGKTTGQRVTHYIIKGGPFDRATTNLLRNKRLTLYQDQLDEPTAAKKRASKTKYTCPECGLNAWAKPDADMACLTCERRMKPASPATTDDEDD